MSSMDMGYPLRHCSESRKFPAEKRVMSGDDIICQLMWRELCRVRAGRGFVREFGFEVPDDFIKGDAFSGAGLAQRAAPLAAEVDLKRLENAGASGSLGN